MYRQQYLGKQGSSLLLLWRSRSKPLLPIDAFWRSLTEEPHPLVQLYWLKDLYELVLRWCVAIALGYHRSLNEGEFPSDLRDELGPMLERPTLGQCAHFFSSLGGRAR